jgi:Family of unknown function (DUF6308)
VPAGDTTLRVTRLDGGVLVLEGGGLAAAFLRQEQGQVDAGPRGSITGEDVASLNRMGARSPHGRWSDVLDRRLSWLDAIDPRLDLIAAGRREWVAAGGGELVAGALTALIGPGRGLAVVTKLLHLKRPRLFPMLDQLVVEMLGARISADAPAAVKAKQATELVAHLRDQGRANLPALRRIRSSVAAGGVDHSLVRILDAVLWYAHPAAASPGLRRQFSCGPIE